MAGATQQAMFTDKHEGSGNKYGYNLTATQNKALRDMIEKQDSLKMDYVDFVAKATDWKKNNTEQATQLRMQNKKFYVMMAGLMVIPFRNGVNARSIASAAGMYMGMCMFNKGFRDEFGPSHIVNKVMYPYYKQMSEKYPNSVFVQKFDSLRTKMAIENNDGRLPMTPETAAMTKIGFIEKAYNDMRERPEDANEIIDGYNKAVDVLNELCERDGVDYDEVNRQMSGIIAVRSDHIPNYYKYFAECNNGQANMLYETKTGKDENGNLVMFNESTPQLRNGKLVYALGPDSQPYTGGFSPRIPNSEAYYANMSYQYCKDYATHFEKMPLEYGSQLSDMAFNMQQSMQSAMMQDDHKFVYPDSSPAEAYQNLCNMTSEFAVASHAGLAVDVYDKAMADGDTQLAEEAKTAIIETYGGIMSMAATGNAPDVIFKAHEDFVNQAHDAGVRPEVFNNIKINVENEGTAREQRSYDVPDETFQLAYEYCKQMSAYVPQQWFEGANRSVQFETDMHFEDKAWTKDRYGNMSHEDGSAAYGEDSSRPKNDGHMPNGASNTSDYDYVYMQDDMGPMPGGDF